MFQRIQNIGEGFARKAASATELLADRELRRYLVSPEGAGTIWKTTEHTRATDKPFPPQEGTDSYWQKSWRED
jgi:hypothetical protein